MQQTNLYIKEFLDYLRLEKGSSEKTIKSYNVDIKYFFNFTNKSYNKIIKDDIFLFIEHLKSFNFKHNTIQRKISSLKSFYRFLYINKYIEIDPINSIKTMKKQKRLPEVLDENDFKKIIETYNSEPNNVRDKLILKLLIATGARVSEIVNLNISDIEDNDYKYIRVLGKGSKYRYIPIYHDIALELKNFILREREILKSKNTYKLFPNTNRSSFYSSLKKHSLNANIEKKVYPHIIRHSIATILLKNGADIRVVQELLGHSSISTTEIYTHVEKSKLKSIYDKIKIGEEDD